MAAVEQVVDLETTEAGVVALVVERAALAHLRIEISHLEDAVRGKREAMEEELVKKVKMVVTGVTKAGALVDAVVDLEIEVTNNICKAEVVKQVEVEPGGGNKAETILMEAAAVAAEY